MELGLYTFADVQSDTVPGKALNTHQRIKDLMEEIKLADEVGLDVFGVGIHHRPDYAVSSPATILAAAAVSTKNIKLTSAVTVLSSDDPVRIFAAICYGRPVIRRAGRDHGRPGIVYRIISFIRIQPGRL